jgi:hypothetical protein
VAGSALSNDFTKFRHLSFRGALGHTASEYADHSGRPRVLRDASRQQQRPQHDPHRRSAAVWSSHARNGGWHNEMETIRIRTTDFLNNGPV